MNKNEKKTRKIAIFPEFFSFFFVFLSCVLPFLLPVVELMKNDEKWWNMIKKWKKMKTKWKKWKKLRENCNFPKKWKIAIFPEFFSFFFIFFIFFIFFHFFHLFIIFHHFCFQWCKNFPKNKKNGIFLEFFHFFIIMIKKLIKKWKKTRGKLQFSIF